MIPSHTIEHLGIAALGWQVNVIANVVVGSDCLKQFFREIFWVRRCKPELHVGKWLGWFLEEVLEPIPRKISEFKSFWEPFRILMVRLEWTLRNIVVAIDILPQKSYLFHSLTLQRRDFPQYGVNLPTPLSSSHKRHNAERTHVVASSHDW